MRSVRHLVSRTLFFLGSIAFSWAAFAFVLIEGPLAPSHVGETAVAFTSAPLGRSLLEQAVNTAAETAGLEPSLTQKATTALFEDPAFLPSVTWTITSRYTQALGEDPGVPPAGVRPPEELLQDAARAAGAPSVVVDRLSLSLPEPRLPMASFLREQAAKLWWPLMRLAVLLLALSALIAPRLSAGLARIGRLLIGASLVYVLLGVVVPYFLERTDSATWSFLALMLRTALQSVITPAIVCMGLGAALVSIPPRFRRA